MPFFVAGRISGQVIVESGFRGDLNLTTFRQAIAANYGGVYTDYCVFTLSDTDSKSVRVRDRDQWVPVWVGDEITDIDFSAWDARGWIRFTASKTDILSNNNDTSMVYTKVYNSDESEIDTTFTGNLDIDVSIPSGKVSKMRFIFNKGQASKMIKSDTSGVWIFPASNYLVGNFKVNKSYIVKINSIA